MSAFQRLKEGGRKVFREKKESGERAEGYEHGVGSMMEKSHPLCLACGFKEGISARGQEQDVTGCCFTRPEP